MKCNSCHKKLKYHYYLIGGLEYCKSCALECMSDLKDFKIKIETKGGK